MQKLLAAFRKLIEGGGSLLVIEHNLDVIKSADYVIDLGPEGGSAGGQIVATGTPEEIAANPASHTGHTSPLPRPRLTHIIRCRHPDRSEAQWRDPPAFRLCLSYCLSFPKGICFHLLAAGRLQVRTARPSRDALIRASNLRPRAMPGFSIV